MAVILVHSAHPFPSVGNILYTVFFAGRYGVDLFFVISGFALFHAFRGLERRSSFPRLIFLFQRWARLAPLYYFGTLLYGLLARFITNQPVATWTEAAWNLTFLNGWIPNQANATVPGGWSISAEAAFAILFIGLVPMLHGFRSALVVTISSWLITHFTGGRIETLVSGEFGRPHVFGSESVYVPWQHLPTFLFGVCCWHVWNNRRSTALWISAVRQIVYAVIGITLILALAFELRGLHDRTLLAGGGAAFLVLAGAERGFPRPFSRGLAALGRISFGLYLFHFAFLPAAQTAAVTLLPIGSASLIFVTLTLLMTLAGAAPLAFLSWRFLERPVQDRARTLSQKGAVNSEHGKPDRSITRGA